MELEELLAASLLPLALICAAWICLPDVLMLLGKVRIQRGFSGGPEEVAQHPEYGSTELCDELTALGFRPLGVYWETVSGHKMFHELVFTAADGDCFGKVYRLFDNDPARAAFFSTLCGEATVMTQNYHGGMEADEDQLRAGPPQQGSSAMATVETAATSIEERMPLAVVLAEHRHRLQRFAITGHPPERSETTEDFLSAEEVYCQHPRVAWELRQAAIITLPLKLAFLALWPAPLTYEVGLWHPATWAALLLGCLGVIGFRHCGYPLLAVLSGSAFSHSKEPAPPA